ncbi:C39 family peptidase [Lentibacillus sp. Marseille-P4043]|uniref:C39 family peptidase n=1 Tax=Lentibacillus sp. Marseille-P4043 TaxID=2040293 RepID=UPI0018F89E53|nr:C39 family peptidase [Lentibacillus sp. Marseille-P4043]
MHITLFFISCLIAIYFIFLGEKVSKKWVSRSFKLYAVLFTISAILIGSTYISEHKTAFIAAAKELLPISNEPKLVEPAEAMVSQRTIKESVRLQAPLIGQLPELPRGCEVTSLAMLLNYHDIDMGKMELAKQVKQDPTPYKKTDKGVYFGNPNNGFVGDMYSFTTPGFGVYHKPIMELAGQYAGERVLDFTGQDFGEIINQLNQERPVWVIINATYDKLPEKQFTTWQTPDGPINITMKEHSVLITGYDQDYIYFNDPLKRDKKAPIEEFKAAWVQMGKQAITIL